MKLTKICVIMLILLVLSSSIVLAAPENTRELINELNNPSKIREYRKAVDD